MSFYLYTDASIKVNNVKKNNSDYAYIGGMITDNLGKILFSFYDKIHSPKGFKLSDIHYAEAAAVEIGLAHAESMGIKDIKCFTDSMNCVSTIQNFQFNLKSQTDKKIKAVKLRDKYIDKVLDIVCVTEEFFDNFEIKHIPRIRNQYADHMSHYLRVFKEEGKAEIKKFKNMLKTALLSDCNYDFTNERKEYIVKRDKERAELRAAHKKEIADKNSLKF